MNEPVGHPILRKGETRASKLAYYSNDEFLIENEFLPETTHHFHSYRGNLTLRPKGLKEHHKGEKNISIERNRIFLIRIER